MAPRPEDFPRLLEKMGTSMAKDFDFSDEVRGLKVPMLFAAADADMFPPSHAVEVLGAARRRRAGRRLAGRGPAGRRARPGDHPGHDPLQHLHLAGPGRRRPGLPGRAAGLRRYSSARPSLSLTAPTDTGSSYPPLDEPDAGPQAGVALALVELPTVGQSGLAAPVLEGQVVLLALVFDGDLERRDEDVEGLA